MRVGAIVLAAALALHGAGVSADDDGAVLPRAGWNGLHTANFYIIGDVGSRELKDVTRQLEQFRDTLGILFPRAPLGSATPTTVLVFKTHRSYEPIKPSHNGKTKDIVGFFQPGTTVNYITMTTQDGFKGLGVVYHEYVHLVVNNTVQNMPLWFNEGLADYYSTFEVNPSGDRAILGKVIPPHVLRLRQQWVPLEQLAAVDHDSPLYNESDKMSVFYAESWALVHYLLVGNDRQLAPKASTFLSALINGTPFAAACEQTLGLSVEQLEKDLRNYVSRETFRSQQVRFTDRIAKIDAVEVSPVSEAEVHATLADVLVHMSRRTAARAELAASLASDASYGPAHSLLGMLALFDHDLPAARTELEKAVASPSATYLCHYYYALTLAQARQANGTVSDEDRKAIEAELGKAIALNADFPDSHAQLAWQLAQAPATRPQAVTEMATALDLSPGKEEYALGLASMLANVADFTRAEALLVALAARAASPTVRQQAGELLASIRDYEAKVKARESASNGNPGGGIDGLRTARNFEPMFRRVEAGETRVLGTLTAIECGAGGVVVLVARVDSGTLRVGAKAFGDVDFISYRHDMGSRIECGARHDDRVLLTYRTDAPRGEGTAGTAVAVEFIPDDYEP